MLSLGSYLLGAAELAVLAASLGFSAYRLRGRFLAAWEGAPARLGESGVPVALLLWISELLGAVGLFHAGAVLAASVLTAVAMVLWPAGPVAASSPEGAAQAAALARPTVPGAGRARAPRRRPAPARPSGERLWRLLVMVAVVAVVVFHWAVTTKHALDRGIFNFDSLWYHLPFSVDMVQSHSLTGMHHVDTVFTNWFYPQSSEVLHAVGILLTGRYTLSLFLNFGWLAVAFLAAWCIGRPYGRGDLGVVAVAIVLECHTLVVREPGAAKNDLMAAALLLAGIAILVEAWNVTRTAADAGAGGGDEGAPRGGALAAGAPRGGALAVGAPRTGALAVGPPTRGEPRAHLPVGWPLAAAGLAVGLAAGTKVTVLAMAEAISLAVLVLAPMGRRGAAALRWFVPALLAAGYWYLRNLLVAGNPVPEIESVGPVSLPHPERLQIGRPDFDIAHYATDTGVWRHYFAPGLHEAFGVLWPLVVFGAAVAALLALFRGRDRMFRWMGAFAPFGLAAYLFTPLSAAGAEGEPVGFGINIRYVIPPLLAGIVLMPLDRWFDPPEPHQISGPPARKFDAVRSYGLLAALVLVFLVTNRPDQALHDQARVFALAFVIVAVGVPALLLYARSRVTSAAVLTAAVSGLLIAVVAIGYPMQRHYLEGRFANTGSAAEQIPSMDLDKAYRWARGVDHARVGLAGTTAGFANYGFYGTDLTNRVIYLGEDGPHGAYNATPTCAAFRAAVNAANLDYLVTAPFLNFLHPGSPIPSPEARWLRGES